jgi:hypothetical protein
MDRGFCRKAKKAHRLSPDWRRAYAPSNLTCEMESVANHNPSFTVERNSLRQIKKWPDGDRHSHKSAWWTLIIFALKPPPLKNFSPRG